MADLTITASQVQPGTTSGATFLSKNAGAAITAGQGVYLDSNDVWQLADANASATTANIKGIAVNNAATGQPVKVQTAGDITIGAAAAMAIGTIYVASANAGGIAPSTDLATGWFTSVYGVATTAAILKMGINVSGVQVP